MSAGDTANLFAFALPQLPNDSVAVQQVGERFVHDRRFGAYLLDRRLLQAVDSVCLLLDHLDELKIVSL